MPKYRGGIIGLGWTGMLYDLPQVNPVPGRGRGSWKGEDINRPTPELDPHVEFHLYDHPGRETKAMSYAEALWDRPEVDLVAGCDRVPKRRELFTERYGVEAVYEDAEEMLRKEKLDIVAIPSNVKGRVDMACLAVKYGVKGIFTEKPLAHTLEEADRAVMACSDAGVPFSCGMITTTHPSFATAKELVRSGAIGEVLSIEAMVLSQHQNWSYFVDSEPAWVIGIGDKPRREEPSSEAGSDEFMGKGIMVTSDGLVVHFPCDEWALPAGAPRLRITGAEGELAHYRPAGWKLRQVIDVPGGRRAMVEMPWPGPQIVSYGAHYGLADVIDCIEGRLDEPKSSVRRVSMAMEVEIGLKQSSARGGVRVDLPLEDRSLGLNYRAFR